MRIGIIGMGLETSRDFRFAGVARYAFSLMDEIAKSVDSPHQFEFFLLPSFEIPDSWKSAPHVRINRTWKRYNKWTLFVAGLIAQSKGLDFLLSTANSVPMWSKVPCGVFIHDLFPLDHPEWFPEKTAAVNQRTMPTAIAKSKIVFANSEHTKKSIIRNFGTKSEKICVTPLAAGNVVERVVPDRIDWDGLRALGIRNERFILTLSTIEPRKNLGRVFEAFAEVRRRNPDEDVELVVAGSKGWKYEAALAKIQSLGLESHVTLLGYVPDEDLPGLFSACELYLCASISEGFGMPLVEAMMAGCPVLSSDGGALPEVGGDAVRYFNPESVESLADALSSALSAPEEEKRWSQKSLDQSRKFSWRQTAEATIDRISKGAQSESDSKVEILSVQADRKRA